jgi:hypothetical protein
MIKRILIYVEKNCLTEFCNAINERLKYKILDNNIHNFIILFINTH